MAVHRICDPDIDRGATSILKIAAYYRKPEQLPVGIFNVRGANRISGIGPIAICQG